MIEALSYDIEALAAGAAYANLSVFARADSHSNLAALYTPADNRHPVRCVDYRFSLVGQTLEALEPLVTQFYPAYQETIWGTEGLILTQRIFVPYETAYERAVCWLIEVQAEGPRVLQVDIVLDFGAAPVVTRLQDGLLVATQSLPDARPCVVFGSTGPATLMETLADGCVRLVYHVLVEGEVEQPFVLSLSEADESLAWNGFLMLGDTERVLRQTVRAVGRWLATTRIYTPDATINRGLAWARLNAMRVQQRYRWGHAVPRRPAEAVIDVADAALYALAANWLAPDFVGRLLDFLVHAATLPDGGLAAQLDAHTRRRPATSSLHATALFLLAWQRHRALSVVDDLTAATEPGARLPLASDLPTHQAAATAAAAYLASHREAAPALTTRVLAAWADTATDTVNPYVAAAEATFARNETALTASNEGMTVAARALHALSRVGPPGEVVAVLREAGEEVEQPAAPGQFTRRVAADAEVVLDPLAGPLLIALALEGLLGLRPRLDEWVITPQLPADWPWLAGVGIPYRGRRVDLAIAAGMVHSTENILSPGQVEVYDRAAIIPGDVFAILFQRPGTRRLFVAADEPQTSFVRVGDRGVPVQLQAGEAKMISVE